MSNTKSLVWNKNVRFLTEDSQVALVNIENGSFAKIHIDAKLLIDIFLDGNIGELKRRVSGNELDRLHKLVETLRHKGYICLGGDTQAKDVVFQLSAEDYLLRSKTAYFSVCDKCNLTCLFCYASPKRIARSYRGETQRSKEIIDQLAKINVRHLIMSGGEPLLREDLFELIAYAKQSGMAVGLTTNGTLIGKTEAEKLVDSGIDYVQVSIESANKEEHDTLRGKGSFSKSVEAVSWLKESGLNRKQLFITATTTKGTLEAVNSYSAFAESIGVSPSFSFYQPVGRAKHFKSSHLPSQKEQINFMRSRIIQSQCIISNFLKPQSKNSPCVFDIKVANSCSMGFTTIGIKEDGEVVPCHLFLSYSSFGIGNILDADVMDKIIRFINGLPTVDSIQGCQDCNVRYFCHNGCWAYTYWESGSFDVRNPYCGFYKKFWSSVIWNIGKQNETELIIQDLDEAQRLQDDY